VRLKPSFSLPAVMTVAALLLAGYEASWGLKMAQWTVRGAPHDSRMVCSVSLCASCCFTRPFDRGSGSC